MAVRVMCTHIPWKAKYSHEVRRRSFAASDQSRLHAWGQLTNSTVSSVISVVASWSLLAGGIVFSLLDWPEGPKREGNVSGSHPF
jgi:hypothetical protein